MNKKIFLIIAAVLIGLLGLSGFFVAKKLLTPQKTHYHAGFVVFQDGKKLDFSGNAYMFVEPCVINSKHIDSDADIQIEKAHLHDNVGDVVHIERTGAKWQDLFANLQYSLDYKKTTGYSNGKQVPNFQLQSIKPYDSLVVFIGRVDKSLLGQAVTKNHIIEKAKSSGTCGD